MLRSNTLMEADTVIHGARQAAYGNWDRNFQDIASIWSVQLGDKLNPGTEITPTEVALMMAGLKLAREIHAHKHDNMVDAAGYIAIADALSEAE